MFISSRVLEFAVSRILKELQISPDSHFACTALFEHWPSTGLRQSDLRDALHEMMDRGLMRVSQNGGSLQFYLTTSGVRRLLTAADMPIGLDPEQPLTPVEKRIIGNVGEKRPRQATRRRTDPRDFSVQAA